MGCCLLVIFIIQATAFKKCKNTGSDPPMKCGGELGLHEGCGGNS